MSRLSVHMRISALSVSNEDVDSRQKAVTQLAADWGKIKGLTDIIAKAAEIANALGGDGTPPAILSDEVERAVQKHASAFLSSERPLEVGVCAGMAALSVMAGKPGTGVGAIVDLYSNALWSALAFQPLQEEKREALRREVLDRAKERSLESANTAREREPVPEAQDLDVTVVAEGTQHFNTTSSMGRLTLNVLLSFAQFEREVTGERIRDKFAASRRKGLWMGGNPPLGYDVADRKLVVNEEEAERVRAIFGRYAELGSVKLLAADLQERAMTSKRWTTQGGTTRGGVAFSRGALYKLLNNRVYRGEAMHKGIAHPGEHAAIVPDALWERAQAVMEANRVERRMAERATAPSPLAGLLFDDRGNPMSPSHSSRKGRRYRYYVSQALLNHRPEAAGSLTRVPAQAVEELVLDRVSTLLTAAEQRRWAALTSTEQAERLAALLQRVELGAERVRITVRRLDGVEARAAARITSPHDRLVESGDTLVLEVAARLKTWGGERVIVEPDGRELREQAQVDDTLMKALARAHRWCRQLASGEVASVAALAEAAGCTPAYVTQLLSLAFLAPDIVEMILRGAQPKRLTLAALLAAKLPLSWREQRRVLGLSPAQ